MLDDLRNHEAKPTREESEWVGLDPLMAATRALVMVGVAMMVGVAASYVIAPEDPGVPVVASAGTPAP
ncbi:MAG TPA: hypothetical protein VLS49_17480 [Usitatibacter sp.]|nr:hypothetical protein [Usitatibacter sp.]